MGASNHRRAVIQQVADGGQSRHNALVTGNFPGPLVLGDIEVAAQQHLLAGDSHIRNGLLVIVHMIHLLLLE